MKRVSRREALRLLAAAGAAAGTGCLDTRPPEEKKMSQPAPASVDPVLSVNALAFQWQTLDPFLFCVHHDDRYPAGNEAFGPAASLAGRRIGMDFEGLDGWRMYHGEVVPGFPQHPHRGFETVTIVRRGLLDHSDSLGAAARYGRGDVQWLTAGRGILHAEMFPLLDRADDNPVELFQIWLNLPAKNKMVEPRFSMLWAPTIPSRTFRDEAGRETTVTVVAGRLGEMTPPSPPPDSYASAPESDVAIWTIRLAPGARWTVPTTHASTTRSLYLFEGRESTVGGRAIEPPRQVVVRADVATELVAGPDGAELLMLQGKPIGEPVAHHGPFVMNTRQELEQAYADYRRTRFGGWPWDRHDPVHGAEPERFARHADGRTERPT